MSRLLAVFLGLAAIGSLASTTLAATLTVSDFNDFSSQFFPPMVGSWNDGTADQYIQGAGFISITPVGTGNPEGDGSFYASFPDAGTVDISSFTNISLTARIDPGNASSVFRFSFYEGANEVATATFQSSSFNSSFSTQWVALTLTGLGNPAAVSYWSLAADGLDDAVRVSLENTTLSTVPEPSAYAACAVAFLGLAIVRRELRRRRVL
jgi:hypothetical protein